jgi:TetR/AcrR family transcriptional regulator, transcriptional repressor for nem operon
MTTAGRPRDFDEGDVLDRAVDIFWRQGYEATSLDQLLAAMKLGKGSMYHNFGNKREVFKLALDRFMHNFTSWFTTEIGKAKDPIDFIRDFFMTIPRQDINDHRKGCFLGNTVAELACIDPGLEKMAVKHLATIEHTFHKYIKEAQANGRLKSKENAKLIARHLINLWNGLNITRRMYPDQQELLPLIKLQLSILS